MAYAESTAGSRPRSRRHNGDGPRIRPVVPEESSLQATGSSYTEDRDWRRAGLVGSAILAGAALGAGVALLLAPQSGEGTRADLARGARRMGWRARDAWDDLRDELAWASRRGGRQMRRRLRRGEWLAEDAVARGRRRVGR